MAFEDKTLVCRDCSKEFTWTQGEQQFFSQKGFDAPVRCPGCRNRRRQEKTVSSTMHEITCSKCGKKGEVPFSPRDPKGVLCAECFQK